MDRTRQIALIAASLAALGLGACGGDTRATEAAGPTPTATTEAVPTPTAGPATAGPTTAGPATTTATRSDERATEATSGEEAFEAEVVALVNDQRVRAGCPAVTVDDRLTQAARAHSQDMAARGYFDHTTPEGVSFSARITAAGYAWSSAAENIAAGQSDPTQVMEAWMDSDGHRRNILDCGLREIGVGLAYDARDRPIWTQEFATPRA